MLVINGMNIIRPAVVVTLLLSLIRCVPSSATRDLAAADRAVAEFHRRVFAGEDELIYRDGAPEFRSTITLAELKKANTNVRETYGALDSSRRASFKIDYGHGSASSTITQVYKSQFARGDATEQFTWKLNSNGVVSLLHYDIHK